jgi:GTP pyrophosphokinase
MHNKNYSFDDLYDILAMRIIVSTIPECYTVLGIIHTHYLPITGEFSDYIASPKSNHYQSLHTCVKTENNLSVEMQIRTLAMHEHAEYGIAAHWRYKEGGMGNPEFEEKIAWIRRIIDLEKNDQLSSQQLSNIFKNEVFADKIYVITPKGQVMHLPKGSTIIDFAYQIHNDIGNRCKGAKIDNKIVPLSTIIKNGQMVEVLCNKEPCTNMNWIYNKWVTTSKARQAIKKYFRNLASQSLSYNDQMPVKQNVIINKIRTKVDINNKQLNMIEIAGYKDIMHHIAKCCRPIPDDKIIGFVTQVRGIAIHRTNCTNLANLITKSPNKFIEINWSPQAQTYPKKFNVDFSMVAIDREKLLKDITEVCAGEKLNISNLVTICKQNKASIKFTVQISYSKDIQEVINRLINNISSIAGVIEINRN